MASVCDVIAALDKFELSLIEKQWTDDIWISEFTTCPDDLPEEFSDKFSPLSYCDIVQVIEDADKIINLWLTASVDASTLINDADTSNSSFSNTSLSPSWTLLQEVNYKNLLALLYYYACKGQINNQDNNMVHTCMKATNFYFTLLTIPGSDIYKIFHISLFEKCLETLAMHKFLEIATGRKIKKSRSARKSEDMSSDDEFLEMDETLTLSQQQTVVKQLNCLMSTFQQFVNKFSFKKHPEALNMTLQILADLTRLERNSNLHEFSTNNTITSFVPLSRNAYLTMKGLCSNFHGRISEIIRLVLFHLVPNLTSVGGLSNPEFNKFTQKELTNIRSIAVSFITENIIPIGDDASLGLKILVQQLCYNMIDRADYRSKATDMVLTILCKLPTELYYSLIKWIFRMSMMEGAHHRVISLELLSKLIFMKPGSNEVTKLTDSQFQHIESQLQCSENISAGRSEIHQKTDYTTNISQEPIVSFSQPVNYVPLEFRRTMLAIIIDRIRDEAAIVRTRALSILAEIIANKTSQALQMILRDLFIYPYSDMNAINLSNCDKENEFLKWKTFVGYLDKIQDADITKHMFPGARVIINKVFEKCLDERVNVRKAALQVISSLFKFSSKWMTSEALALFGKHCRDPALSIRKDMINSVTELMLFFPDHEPVMDLWVEEVVPLLMDREIKVQEQALQIFTNVILSKIKAFKDIKSHADELPWKILDKIAKQNKRSFFMAACTLWSESGQFNQSIVTTLKSHIGTLNEGPAWMFLACMSEYFDIEKPNFVMEYYLDVISKDIGDKNRSYFALLTLSTSWQKLPREKMEILQLEMYNKLKSYTVNPTFVTLTVEIVAGITVYIAEDELSGKKEVAKWGIEMIQDCETHIENCLKDKTRDCPNCINILALLGALVPICPDKIKNPTFTMLFNFLMESSSGGSAFDRKMCAITVITVSKMALHNDHFARSLVSGLAQLLSQSSDPIVLNNVIVAIADIGESYASLIEPVIPFICIWLKSKHQSLKEITMVLLIELLQEDYLKARDVLVFHLLTMVNEKNPWLVNMVKYYFTNSLLARNPYKMYQLLLPALFHFNNYTSHPDYPKLDMTDAEWQAFDMSGPENHSLRMNIYKFMLLNVPYMVKMKCLHFVCTVVLNGVADSIINIKGKNGEQLLFDALCVLTLPEIKLEYNDLVKGKNDDGEEEDDQKQMPLCKLVKQMFTAVQKKEIIETIIPICCKLKKKLLLDNKRLLPYLRKFIRELVKDYKSEINEIFKEDKQFGIEILHELNTTRSDNGENEDDDDDRGYVQPAVTNENLEKSNVDVPVSDTNANEVVSSSNHSGNLSRVDEEQRVLNSPETVDPGPSVRSKTAEPPQKEPGSSGSATEPISVPPVAPSTSLRRSSHSNSESDECGEGETNSKMNSDQRKKAVNNKQKTEVKVLIERLSPKYLQKLEKTRSKRNLEEENLMKSAVENIILPPPVKGNVKNKKNSLLNTRSANIQSPITPMMSDKKELLTSTPLVVIGNPNFDVDMSSVVDESS
ncbi:hypothetical protein RUM44_009760 [Polyplax serrata]|uniref:Condensin-2 complex subunit D3 n=1 Tax=Polyplax serrata TaxID=468196 RepID=A0ABR1ATL3_POLSC